jgi:glycosyltransferase involved in cell wall biosynthesis
MVIVVLPAYNCENTLEKTLTSIPKCSVDNIILVDDFSTDHTIEIANKLGIKNIYRHAFNKGYGANQKTCYDKALEAGANLVIMLHPDYQYDPKLIPKMIQKITEGADIVFASRMKRGKEALKFGMPFYKYIANRLLTAFQNKLFRLQLSEYHTGYRAYRREVLEEINYKHLSDDFIFDNQITLEFIQKQFKIEEIYCPAKYMSESSSINLRRSIKYGLGVIYYSIWYKFFKKNRIGKK